MKEGLTGCYQEIVRRSDSDSLSFIFYERGIAMSQGQFKKLLKTNSSTILTCLGIAGIIGTAILSATNALKATKKIKELELEKGEELTVPEKIKAVLPICTPSIIVAASTIVCVVGSNIISKRKLSAALCAYTSLVGSLSNVKATPSNSQNGDVENRKIDLCDMPDKEEPLMFYEPCSDRFFEATMLDVLKAEYSINRIFVLRGSVSINDFYNLLGLPKEEFGSDMGWSMSLNYSWINFNYERIEIYNGIECYILSYENPPETDYDTV